MGFHIFLKIEGLKGSSRDSGHEGWIDIMSYSHGLYGIDSAYSPSRRFKQAADKGPPSKVCEHDEFSLIKRMDRTSPLLNFMCCEGRVLEEVKIQLCFDNERKQKFMEYKLSGARIICVKPGGSGMGMEKIPLEEVSFDYQKIEWIYTELDGETGEIKGNYDIKVYWDCKTNRGGCIKV